jgi:hypothetical protein
VRVDRVGERQHRARPLGRGDAAPAAVLERLARGTDGAVDVLRAGLRNLGDDAAGGRVERLEGAAVGGVEPVAADQQAMRAGGERAGGVGQGVRQG